MESEWSLTNVEWSA